MDTWHSASTKSTASKHTKKQVIRGKRWKIICERYHCHYASVEEHQIKNVPCKAWLFKCFHNLNMACNNMKIGTDFYAACLCSTIYIFMCTVLVTLIKTGSNFLSFWWIQNLAVHTNTYMLDDQPFLIDSTTFLSQCNCMTSPWFHIDNAFL